MWSGKTRPPRRPDGFPCAPGKPALYMGCNPCTAQARHAQWGGGSGLSAGEGQAPVIG